MRTSVQERLRVPVDIDRSNKNLAIDASSSHVSSATRGGHFPQKSFKTLHNNFYICRYFQRM